MIPQVQQMLKDLGIAQYVGPPASLDPQDRRYTALVNGSVHAEGLDDMTRALSEEDAVAAYCEGLQKWLAGRTVIIWRHLPELDSEEQVFSLGKKRTYWTVYSRQTAYTAEEFHPLEQHHE